MAVRFQTHSGREKEQISKHVAALAVPPAGTDIAVDEQADFGYLVPPTNTPQNYLPEAPGTID